MATRLYPPLIEGSLPAFYKKYDTAGKVDKAEIIIPFEINRTVSATLVNKLRMRIRTIATNTELVNIESVALTKDDELITKKENLTAKFVLNKAQAAKFNEGQFYMVQIAFVEETYDAEGNKKEIIGYYSNLGTIKCVAKPSLKIEGFNTDSANSFSAQEVIGVYSQDTSFGDSTEKVNTYSFQIWDGNGNIILDSGELLHNTSEDVSSYESQDRFIANKLLQEGILYYIQYNVTTINKLSLSSPIYLITQGESIPIEAKVKFHGESSFEEGYVKLWLQGDMTEDEIHEEIVTGTFMISRASDRDNYITWEEIIRFNLSGGAPSEQIFRDFTVEQGVPYKYRIQQYNAQKVFSAPLPLTYSLSDEEAGLGICGEEKIITPDFEDMFLYDGERQLKIKFNPKVSSFKNTIPEQKIETIGSKYPFIFRNGQVSYKEFPISGLLSFQTDNTVSFFTMEEAEIAGILSPIKKRGALIDGPLSDLVRSSTGYETQKLVEYPAGPIIKKIHESAWVPGCEWAETDQVEIRQDKNLTSENIMGERYFKLKVLDWLSNGEVKLFRSPTEGNYLVRLLNVSMTPQDTLGRMLHQFTCTAYEIADLTYDNLVYYKFLKNTEPDLTERQWGSIDINQIINTKEPIDNWYPIEINTDKIDRIEFSDFYPTDKFRFQFTSSTNDEWEYIIIGQTGGYDYRSNDRYINKIEFQPAINDNFLNFSRIITYSYEGTQTRKFDAIDKIATYVEVMVPFVGPINNLLENYELYSRNPYLNGYVYNMVDKTKLDNSLTEQYYIRTVDGYQPIVVDNIQHNIVVTTNNYKAYGEQCVISVYTDLGDIENNILPNLITNVSNESSTLDNSNYIFPISLPSLITIQDSEQVKHQIINDHDLFDYTINNDEIIWNKKIIGFADLWMNKELDIVDPSHKYSPKDEIILIKDVNTNQFIPIGVQEVITTNTLLNTSTYVYPWTNSDTCFYRCSRIRMEQNIQDNNLLTENIKFQYMNILNDIFNNILKNTESEIIENLGTFPNFDNNLTYYTKQENIIYKKEAKAPEEIVKVIPTSINFDVSPTVSKFHLTALDILHVRKRDVIPIYALDGDITIIDNQVTFLPNMNSSYCITPFFNGYVNQSIPYNLKDELKEDTVNGYTYWHIAIDEQIKYQIDTNKIIAFNQNDIDLIKNIKTNISKHSILQIYRPVLVLTNSIIGQQALNQQHLDNKEYSNYIAIDWEPVPIDTGFAYYDTNAQAFFEPNVNYEPYFSINNLSDDAQILTYPYIIEDNKNNISLLDNKKYYTSANKTNIISLQETEEITLKHLGEPDILYLGNGVMAELTCQIRVTDFLIEKTIPSIAAAKELYLSIKNNYYEAISTYYDIYYRLQDANANLDIYIQKIDDLNTELQEYISKVGEIYDLLDSNMDSSVFKQQVVNTQNNTALNIIDILSKDKVYGAAKTNSYNSQSLALQANTSIATIEFVALLKILGITTATYDPEYIQNQTADFMYNLSQKMKSAFTFSYNNISKFPPNEDQFALISELIDNSLQYNEILSVNSANYIISVDTTSIGYWPFTLLLEPKVINEDDRNYWYCYPSLYHSHPDVQLLTGTNLNRQITIDKLTDENIYSIFINRQIQLFEMIKNDLFNSALTSLASPSWEKNTLESNVNQISTVWSELLQLRIYSSTDPTSIDIIVQEPQYLMLLANVIGLLSNDINKNYFDKLSFNFSLQKFLSLDLAPDKSYLDSNVLPNKVFQYELINSINRFVENLLPIAENCRERVKSQLMSELEATDTMTQAYNSFIESEDLAPLVYDSELEGLYFDPIKLLDEDEDESFLAHYSQLNIDYSKYRKDYISLLDFITNFRLLINKLKTEEYYNDSDDNYSLLPINSLNEIKIEDMQNWFHNKLKILITQAYPYWHKSASAYLNEDDLDKITSESFNAYFYPQNDINYALEKALRSSTADEIQSSVKVMTKSVIFMPNKILYYVDSLPNRVESEENIYFISIKDNQNIIKEYRGYQYNEISEELELICSIPAKDIYDPEGLNTDDKSLLLSFLNCDMTLDEEEKQEQINRIEATSLDSLNPISLLDYLSKYYLVKSWLLGDPTNSEYQKLLSSIIGMLEVRRHELQEMLYSTFGFFRDELWEIYIGELTFEKDKYLIYFTKFIEDILDYTIKATGFEQQQLIYNNMAEDPNTVVYKYENIKQKLDAQIVLVNQWIAVKDSCELMLSTEAYGIDLDKKAELEDTLNTANYKLVYERAILRNFQKELDDFKLTNAYTKYLIEANKLNIAEKEMQIAYLYLYGTKAAKKEFTEDTYFSIQSNENNEEIEIVGSFKEYSTVQHEYDTMVNEYLKLILDFKDKTNTSIDLGLKTLIDFQNEISNEQNTSINLTKIEEQLNIYEQEQQELIGTIYEMVDMILDFTSLFKGAVNMREQLENLLKYYDGDPDTLEIGIIQKTRDKIREYEELVEQATNLINKYGDKLTESLDENKMKENLYDALSSFLSLLQHYYTTVIEERYGE